MSWYDRRKRAGFRNPERRVGPPLPRVDVQFAVLPTAPLGFLSLSVGASINYAARREEQGGYVWSIGASLLVWQLTVSFWRYAGGLAAGGLR